MLRKAEFSAFLAKSQQRIVQKLEDESVSWVRRIKESCLKDLERISESYDQMYPAADPLAIKHLTTAKKATDDMMRRALGMPDAPIEHKHSGEIDHNLKLTEENLNRLNELRKRFPIPNLGFSIS